MTYKSIDTILASLRSSSPPKLVPFVPILDVDESAKRELLMTPALHAWCYQADASRGRDYKPNVRAFLGRFVKGHHIDNEDFMKCWTADVWEFRVQFEKRSPTKPHRDNTRIFGAFATPDLFVAFHPARLRSHFGDKSDPKWQKQIDDVCEKWTALFGMESRVKATPFSKCVSSNFYDCNA